MNNLEDLWKAIKENIAFSRRNKFVAIGILIVLAAIPFFYGFFEKLGEIVLEAFSQKNGEAHVQSDIVLSRSIKNCYMGFLEEQFRGWAPKVHLIDGAQSLVVCADIAIDRSGLDRITLLKAFQRSIPECISLSGSKKSPSIGLNTDSGYVCRAPYRFDGFRLKPVPLEQGMFVCIPGYRAEKTEEFFMQQGKRIEQCSEDVLRKNNFL